MQPEPQRKRLDRCASICFCGPVKVQTWSQLRICAKTLKLMFTDSLNPIWLNFSYKRVSQSEFLNTTKELQWSTILTQESNQTWLPTRIEGLQLPKHPNKLKCAGNPRIYYSIVKSVELLRWKPNIKPCKLTFYFFLYQASEYIGNAFEEIWECDSLTVNMMILPEALWQMIQIKKNLKGPHSMSNSLHHTHLFSTQQTGLTAQNNWAYSHGKSLTQFIFSRNLKTF